MAALSTTSMQSSPSPAVIRGSLTDLPPECLLPIIKEVSTYNAPSWNAAKPIKELSRVNTYLRMLCIPFLFHLRDLQVKIRKNKDQLTHHVKALGAAAALHGSLIALRLSLWSDPDSQSQASDLHGVGDTLITTLGLLANLKELQLSLGDKELLSKQSPASLRVTPLQLPKIVTLAVIGVLDAALFVQACPNLKTFIANYPLKKMKQTCKVLSEHTNIRRVELETYKSWTVSKIKEVCSNLDGIPELCMKGDIKVKLTELADLFRPFQKLESLAISSTPWVNYSYYSKHYMDDRYLDAIDDARDNSSLNEDPNLWRVHSLQPAWRYRSFEYSPSTVLEPSTILLVRLTELSTRFLAAGRVMRTGTDSKAFSETDGRAVVRLSD